MTGEKDMRGNGPPPVFTPKLEMQVALELANEFGAAQPGESIMDCLDREMRVHSGALDGGGEPKGVTPRQAAKVIAQFLKDAGYVK